MLLLISAVLILLTIAAFLRSGQTGVMVALFSGPVIAAAWSEYIIGPLNPGRLCGVLVPACVLISRLNSSKGFSGIPLLGIWAAYSWYAILPSAIHGVSAGPLGFMEVLFRNLSGIAGWVMLQGYFTGREEFRRLRGG